jgi:hypothetical protein
MIHGWAAQAVVSSSLLYIEGRIYDSSKIQCPHKHDALKRSRGLPWIFHGCILAKYAHWRNFRLGASRRVLWTFHGQSWDFVSSQNSEVKKVPVQKDRIFLQGRQKKYAETLPTRKKRGVRSSRSSDPLHTIRYVEILSC